MTQVRGMIAVAIVKSIKSRVVDWSFWPAILLGFLAAARPTEDPRWV
jgi:hypothetical protein